MDGCTDLAVALQCGGDFEFEVGLGVADDHLDGHLLLWVAPSGTLLTTQVVTARVVPTEGLLPHLIVIEVDEDRFTVPGIDLPHLSQHSDTLVRRDVLEHALNFSFLSFGKM